jgi:hypothetical protein
MVYTMSQREIDLRKMAQDKAARLNKTARMKEEQGRTVVTPAPIAKAKKPAKKKSAKSSRKRG